MIYVLMRAGVVFGIENSVSEVEKADVSNRLSVELVVWRTFHLTLVKSPFFALSSLLFIKSILYDFQDAYQRLEAIPGILDNGRHCT